MAGMIFVAIIALKNGDPSRLAAPFDTNGILKS